MNSVQENEIDIPEEYQCTISKKLMITPVYDPNHSQYKFELTNILRWLSIKQENPYTRTSLTSADLVIDEALKQDIFHFKSIQNIDTVSNLLNPQPMADAIIYQTPNSSGFEQVQLQQHDNSDEVYLDSIRYSGRLLM